MLTPIDVHSSSIQALGYDEAAQTLYINFRKGGLYSYNKVPPVIFEEFRKSPAKGKFFFNNIRDKFKMRRIA